MPRHRHFLFRAGAYWPVLIIVGLMSEVLGAASTAPQDIQHPATRYELQLDDRMFKPRDIVKLKLLLYRQYPKVRVNSLMLRRIEVIAKSRLGKGQIALRVGNAISEPATVAGDEKTFQSSDADSFSKTILINNAGDQAGSKWQLFIGGYIKIRRVVLEVTPLSSAL